MVHAAEEARSTVVHPTALVAPGARLGQGVVIGPWCSVGPDVTIEDGVELISHVVVDGTRVWGRVHAIFRFAPWAWPRRI
ncbi:acyl-[acyl-carrier-protein (ACP)]--UDP-N-acetylglucosamine O-acyltransferase [Acetobacter pasteurianus 386B]|nr:acyl-[acyl-carrier-protein (ACP)]--UDP-N-acetylglucosamine O-acyltransferase [Acetobacter pasteurianus 386B]